MGFTWNSEEQRVRINLSLKAYCVIHEDMNAFGETDRSGFMNRVLENFYLTARSSVSIYLEQFQEARENEYRKLGFAENTMTEILKPILLSEKQKILKQLEGYQTGHYESKVYRINNRNLNYLTGEECREEIYYAGKINRYLKCLLEEYSRLSYKERERIYYLPYYKIAEDACRLERMLKLQTADGIWHYVYPYKMMDDPMGIQTYLTCYSRYMDQAAKERIPCSYLLSRLLNIRMLEQSAHLTQKEVRNLNDQIRIRSVQFLVGEETQVKVRLTPEGIRKYHTQIYKRPLMIGEAAVDGICTFLCPLHQAEVYFLQFGAEAEILEPECLRNTFRDSYRKAVLLYEQTT